MDSQKHYINDEEYKREGGPGFNGRGPAGDRNGDRGGEQNPKNRFWTGVLAGALVTAFAGLLIVGMSLGIYLFGRSVMRQGGSVEAQPGITRAEDEGDLDYKSINAKMSLIQQIIHQQFLYEENLDQVEDYLYIGMMAGLDDPYSAYYTKEDFEELQSDTEGVYSGIGALLSQNRMTGLCTVARVFENSPAYESGMLPGDILYEVDGHPVQGEDLSILVNNYIKGKEGTKVTVTVFRQEENEYVDLEMTRRSIEVPTVEYEMLDNQVGYILITQFDLITTEQFKEAVDDLSAQGMKGLVLDLRSNPGGVLDSAVEIADYILPDDLTQYDQGEGKTMIVYTEDKNGQGDHYTASDGHEAEVPIAVLLNGDSASASEVLAGALMDYDRAVAVGTTSYGKGIVQNLIPLGDGSAIKLTVAHYYTPSGFDLHGKGIEPDVEVELDEELQTQAVVDPREDNQVQAAVQEILGNEKERTND